MDKAYQNYRKTNKRSKSVKKQTHGRSNNHRGKHHTQHTSSVVDPPNFQGEWDAPLTFGKQRRAGNTKRAKSSKHSNQVQKQAQKVAEPQKPIEEKKTIEELHKEFKKQRKVKHIDTFMDIDEEFAELPKRLRTRITKKQLHYVMNNTTMGDVIGHLMNNEKHAIIKAPKTRIQKFNPSNQKSDVRTCMLTLCR